MANKTPKEIAADLYAFLKENRLYKEQSTTQLLKLVYGKELPLIAADSDPLMDIHYALLGKVGQGRKYAMDFDKYAHAIVGMPYNIPFIFRLKSEKSEDFPIPIPFFRTGKAYFNWIERDYDHCEIPLDYQFYFDELEDAVREPGYDVPISKKELYAALMESQRTGKMIQVVPDEKYQKGGSNEGQLDGWHYHLELVTPRDYFIDKCAFFHDEEANPYGKEVENIMGPVFQLPEKASDIKIPEGVDDALLEEHSTKAISWQMEVMWVKMVVTFPELLDSLFSACADAEIPDKVGMVYVSDTLLAFMYMAYTRLTGATDDEFIHWYDDVYGKLIPW